MHDVEKQIEQWRNALRASDAFGTSDIDELEVVTQTFSHC